MNSPAFQFYPAEYLADESVQLLSLVEEGAYIRALSYCWREGSIPADPMKLSRLIGKECSQAIAEAILPLFEINTKDPSRLIHKRLEKERTKQQKFKKAMSESGKKGASARWDSQNKEWPGHSQAITRPMASDSSSSSSSSSISSSSSTSINKKKKKNTNPLTPFQGEPVWPNEIDTPIARQEWNRWLTYKHQKRKNYKTLDSHETALRRCAKDFKTPERMIAAIEYSIAQGWDGIYEEKKLTGGKKQQLGTGVFGPDGFEYNEAFLKNVGFNFEGNKK